MTTEPWHLSTAVWQRYAAGELDAVAEASVETHLTSCAVCQSSASETIPSVEVATLWQGVATAIARPRPTRLGRLATRSAFRTTTRSSSAHRLRSTCRG